MTDLTLPDTLQYWKRGCCVPAAIAVAKQLRDDDYVIEGYVKFGRGWWHAHTWMELSGSIFDPTITQFRVLKSFNGDPVRKYAHRFSAERWREIVLIHMRQEFWQTRVREFGVIL